ncbi:hypothetical protein FUAX_55680 (plasmid) [Fulvitalea axinellae]|uniref:Uncharacterized protein n=1 Tax=Fulvitalea axinellae TaxID=1182444 RepID=A0AAU9DJ31_9BACT|nr:hypothetical protein FUAX_55680 [Fulvitalea axinellae]
MFFNSIEEVNTYLPVGVNIAFESISPDLGVEYLLPLLGYELIVELEQAYKDDDINKKLLKHLQASEINNAYAQNLPVAQVNISDSGVRIETEDGKKTAFKHQIVGLRDDYFLPKRDIATEMILRFLERNQADYLKWNKSCVKPDLWIPDATTFDGYYDIGESRTKYAGMVREIRRIQADLERQGGSDTDTTRRLLALHTIYSNKLYHEAEYKKVKALVLKAWADFQEETKGKRNHTIETKEDNATFRAF